MTSFQVPSNLSATCKVPVPGQEYRVAAGDLAEQQRGRRIAVRRAHHFPMGDLQRRQADEERSRDNTDEDDEGSTNDTASPVRLLGHTR